MTDDDLLQQLRRRCFAIAYRMLGSVAEAEDVVQEALLRVHTALEQGQQIKSPRAYAATVTTRLAIDELRSARARRERYVGEWLPEPVVIGASADPEAQAELSDSLSLALLVLLERLSPEQRAVLLLHDVFDYGYDEIGEIIDKRADNVRQLAARARRHIDQHRPRFDASSKQRQALAQRFFAAAQDGDVAALEQLLAEDVVLHGDGGGRVPALARSVAGRDRVARTLAAWSNFGRRVAGLIVDPTEVNGQPGAILRDRDGRVAGVWAIDIADGQIQEVRSIVNPDKLGHLGPLASTTPDRQPG